MKNLQDPICSWDCSIDERYNDYTTGNTEEVLPGITRPLPADLIYAWNYAWHSNATKQLEIQDLVPIPEPPGPTMLTIVAGQFCVNIGMVNALTSTFETGGSADFLKQFFEGDEEEISAEVAKDTSRAELVWAQLMERWGRANELFAQDAERAINHYRTYLNRDWTAVEDTDLIEALNKTTSEIGDIFFSHYLATTGGGLQTTLLENFLNEQAPGHPADWTAGLTSGLTGVESARPLKAIWELSRLVVNRPKLASEIANITLEKFQSRVEQPTEGEWTEFALEFIAFIADMGFRGQRETDPSCLTWNENPQFILSALQANMAAGEERNPHVLEEQAATKRIALEKQVENSLIQEKRGEFRELLGLAQTLNGGREITKANWTRLCRTYRPPILEIGRRLTEDGVIDEAEDIWFLRLAELPEALNRGLSAAELQDAIVERRHEYEVLGDYELPVLFQRPVAASFRQGAEATGETLFQGIGVSPGRASGRARIILSADAAAETTVLPGEILVAPVTDAPWTPIFLPAAGVVVETGGVLSHAATVAREYGIPAVTGIRGATELISNGTMLSIDGATGTVTIEEG